MQNEDYQKAVESVGLKNWTRIPLSERTCEELAEFVLVEPTEHIVGHQYSNGISLVEEICAEIARRLVMLSKENEHLKAALKPVLDCELHIGDSLTEAVGEIGTCSTYGVCDEEGSDLWDEDIADNLNAVREAQRIFKESETEKVAGRE